MPSKLKTPDITKDSLLRAVMALEKEVLFWETTVRNCPEDSDLLKIRDEYRAAYVELGDIYRKALHV